MHSLRRLWLALAAVITVGFLILGFMGREVYRKAPPIPEIVRTPSGRVLLTKDDILDGQLVYQSIGGQQVGSVWGHGAYQAPDWSADWLHREAEALLSLWSRREHGAPFAALPDEAQAALEARLRKAMRESAVDPATGALTISEDRARAIEETAAHYRGLFGDDPALAGLRESYALHTGAVPDAGRRGKLTAFFFWTAWACAAERPGTGASYTNNWPHEPLIGNVPTAPNVVWSVVSVVLLLAGIGALVWYHAFRRGEDPSAPAPARDPLGGWVLTPSMRAVGKYCVVVVALLALQVALGALTAHYTVEGHEVFGLPVADYLPCAVTRTWHVQLGVFWIAPAFLAAGLFLAPAVGGREPRGQRLGVDVLFGALVLVVFGSLLVSGIPGTFHHLYFSGTPVSVMAVGASFSALEVVPLVLVGMEARETWQMQHRSAWMQAYRWPIQFFVAVAFWNFVGAGVFGFLINPPIALYYMQGLNTTPVHAHAALFGVYGLLSLGLVLVMLRRLRPEAVWNEARLRVAFWGMNGGLGLMILLSLLPIGLAQAWASVERGLWYARSAEFLQQPPLEALRWMRFVGDSLFIAGVVAFVAFVAGLWTRRPAGAASGKPAPAGEAAALAAPAASRAPAA
ncbi:cbb3-type cytochrome c oxidase subunit I [Sorangium sp. So ce134]